MLNPNTPQQIHPRFVPFEPRSWVMSSEELIWHLVEGGCSYRWMILPTNRAYRDDAPQHEDICGLCLKKYRKLKAVSVGPIIHLN